MADDIDIEEHDVLESLRRRQAAPDANIVKSEPLDIEYDSQYEDPSNFGYQWDWDKTQMNQIKVEPHTDEFKFGKIILGSKPASPPPQDEDMPGPSRDPQARQENYNYNMSLVIDDWGPMLENSDCYCKECLILFATVNALDAHKMIAHSFLVATDKEASPERNKAIKSTAKPSDNADGQTCEICNANFKGCLGRANLMKHYKRTHNVDPATLNKVDLKSWKICNHCNMYFPNDTSLVKHLYELLPLNNKTPAKDDRKSVGSSAAKVKPVLNIDKTNNAVKDPKFTNVKAVKPANVKDVITKNVNVNPVVNTNKIILGSKPLKDDVNQIKWKCEICQIEYGRKYYLKHMNNFHQGILIDRIKKSPKKVVISSNNSRYKCKICNEILLSEYAVRKHRGKHPEMKRRRMVVKLVKTNKIQKAKPIVIKKEPKIIKKEVTKENKDILVSKSTLFKCNRCSVHFLTCTGACQHSIVCESSSNIRDWACPQCQRVFKSVEKSAHEYQHRMMKANKFKVYVVYLEMIVRVLCECPDCYVCFEEDKFWRHVSNGCHSDVESYYCNKCRLPIDVCSKANHDSKHTQGDFTRDDFIKIDFVSSREKISPVKIKTEFVELESPVKNAAMNMSKRGLKRKLEMKEVPAKRKMALDVFHLYHCQFCKAYLAAKTKFHLTGKCRLSKKSRCICNDCGIYFSQKYAKTHRNLHERFPALTLNDFTFMRMSDSKRIKPEGKLFACDNCHVNFHSKMTRWHHQCGNTVSVHCNVCKKNVHKGVFNIHMQIHNYVIPTGFKAIAQKLAQSDATSSSLSQLTNSPMTQMTRKDTKSPMTQLPDLLMKYQKLSALWNILFLCDTCDTFTDSYDKVVEHCQNHLTNMENYGVVIMKCQICDMKFDSECYKRHLEMHAESKGLTKKTFQILNYDYYNLFSKCWFDFIDLHDEQKSQIVGRSIYGENRCVKMRLIQQGPPEYTLYKCCKCLNCIAPDTIVYHVKLSNCLKANKHACSICDMTFAIRAQCEEHLHIHEVTKLGVESFRIVAFNDASDFDSNQKIMSYDTENHGSKSKISFADEGVLPKVTAYKTPKDSKSYVFYKCAECQLCQLHLKSLKNKHVCTDSTKRECGICGLLFGARYLRIHKSLHEKHKFSRKNVVVKTVNKEGKVINISKPIHEKNFTKQEINAEVNTEEKAKLYKCFCGLHFTSLKTIEKHYKMKNCSTVVREKCSQCQLIFDPIEVVNHLCKHHAQNQRRSFTVVTPNKKTIYKCNLCHILFYTKEAAIPHKGKCVGKFCGKKCEQCGLAFDATSIATHMVDHQRNNKLRPDCYIIVKIPDEKLIRMEKSGSNFLYRCKTCDIHFLRRSSARNHILRSKHGTLASAPIDKCKICRLRFYTRSMPKHVSWQHRKLKITDFKIIDVVYGANTKVTKRVASKAVNPKVNKVLDASPNVKLVKEEPKPIEREVTVYKCFKCAVHFIDRISLLKHNEDRCSKELSEECEDCSAKFACGIIKKHKQLHGNGVILTMNIVTEANTSKEDKIEEEYEPEFLSTDDNKIYRCTGCQYHFNNKKTVSAHACNLNIGNPGLKCQICDIAFTKISLTRHYGIHQKYNCGKDDFIIEDLPGPRLATTQKTDADSIVDETASLNINAEKSDLVKVTDEAKTGANTHFLYKCAECNVYFVTAKACHKHIAKHSPLDSKDYIECKLCAFQFTIMALQTHIKKHHDEHFNLEEVLVEEYQPNDIKSKEIYYASEKDQSRLVSTSDDVKNISNINVENDCEVTSCNDIAEKVESSQQNSAQVDIVHDKDNLGDQDQDDLIKNTETPSDVKVNDESEKT